MLYHELSRSEGFFSGSKEVLKDQIESLLGFKDPPNFFHKHAHTLHVL